MSVRDEMLKNKDYTRVDHIKIEDVRKYLKVQYIENKTDTTGQGRINRTDGITDQRIPKQTLKYKPKGR
jgi:hypothetical protein